MYGIEGVSRITELIFFANIEKYHNPKVLQNLRIFWCH